MSKSKAPKAAPVFFLLETSTAGKSTICGKLQESGWDVYGVDEDLTNDEVRCEKLLRDDSIAEFQKMKEFIQSGAFPKSSVNPFDRGTMGLLFALHNVDEYLKENESLDQIVKETLISLAKKNPDFAEKSGFNFLAMQQRIFDHAIESSAKGAPIIIDGSDGMRERFEQYAKEQGYACQTSVILVHLPIAELAKRMEVRNLRALEMGNASNQRNNIRPFEQYAEFFGADGDATKLAGKILHRADVVHAVNKFGHEGDGAKLCEKLGFQEGQDSIVIGTKVKADAVFDHAKMTTAEITGEVEGLLSRTIAPTPAWRPLVPGDKVALIVPSLPPEARSTPEQLAKVKTFLGEMGLVLVEEETLPQEEYLRWLGTPKQRAEHIIQVLSNPGVKAIFVYGGACSDEVIEILKREKHRLPKGPSGPVAIGLSDAHQALHFLGQELGIVSPVEGPIPEYFMYEKSDLERISSLPDGEGKTRSLAPFKRDQDFAEAVRKFLFEQEIDDIPLVPINQSAIDGAAVGIDGKMVICESNDRKASYRAVTTNRDNQTGEERYPSIALIEVGRRRGGKLEGVEDGLKVHLEFMLNQREIPQAIVLSLADAGCSYGMQPELANLNEIKGVLNDPALEQRFSAHGLAIPPVFFGAPFGHTVDKASINTIPLPYHTNTQIISEGGKVILRPAAARTLENVEEVQKICASRQPYQAPPNLHEEAAPLETLPDTMPIKVTQVHGPSDRFEMVEKSKSSWVAKAAKTPDKLITSEQENFLLCSVTKTHNRYGLAGLEGLDLSGKNIVIGLEFSFKKFLAWQEEVGSVRHYSADMITRQAYEAERKQAFLGGVIQSGMTDPLLELQQTGQLGGANSVTFLLKRTDQENEPQAQAQTQAQQIINRGKTDELEGFAIERAISISESLGLKCPVFIGDLSQELHEALYPPEKQVKGQLPVATPLVKVRANLEMQKSEVERERGC